MFNISVSEAAKRLGIHRSRVLQLIKNGALDAEKIGHIWLIDSDSLEKRLTAKPSPGRPKRFSTSNDSNLYLLMNRNHEILSFRFDTETGSFFDTKDIHDADRAPLGILSPRKTRVSREAIASWWAHRTIPKGRTGIEKKLAELGIAQNYELPFKCMGLSLSDQYWVKPHGATLTWEDINFFHNDFGQSDAGVWLSEVGLDSPDNTSDGMLSKTWICRDGERFLLKGGTLLEQEPFNECVATNLHSRLLGADEYVPYTLEQWGDAMASSCQEFLKDTEEFIPAYYVRELFKQPEYRNIFQHFIESCARLGITDAESFLQKMIVCDDLIANTDRHWRNFGLIRDIETLEYRMAPLFDCGTSLWCAVSTREMSHIGHGFITKPFKESPDDQLRLVNDFSWLNLDALKGFAEKACEILEMNPLLEGRIDFIYGGIQSRIDHLIRIAS